MNKARRKIHELTERRLGCLPLEVVIGRLNKFLLGWSSYYRFGYPAKSFAAIDYYVLNRMIQYLRHRSQRPYKPSEGTSWYTLIYKQLNVLQLATRENLQ